MFILFRYFFFEKDVQYKKAKETENENKSKKKKGRKQKKKKKKEKKKETRNCISYSLFSYATTKGNIRKNYWSKHDWKKYNAQYINN